MGRINRFLLLCQQLLSRGDYKKAKDAEIPERQSASSPAFFATGLLLGPALEGSKRATALPEREWSRTGDFLVKGRHRCLAGGDKTLLRKCESPWSISQSTEASQEHSR